MIVLAAAALAGCWPTHSLHPVYTPETVVFDPGLLGTWVGEPLEQASFDEGTWVFERWEDDGYRVVHTDGDGRRAVLIAHVVQVGEVRYLDLFPDQPGEESSGLGNWHLLPVHGFARIRRGLERIELDVLDPDWLEARLAAEPGALAHEVLDEVLDELVLVTAPPAELQAFLRGVEDDPDAFAPMARLRREAAGG